MRYFGTDGIRGPVGGEFMNPEFIRRVGYALARFLRKHNHAKPITVVVGQDTRESSEKLRKALCQGLCEQNVHVIFLRVVPSPAVSLAVRELQADLGIMLTASHNPATDNGLKLFDNRGIKFTEEAEAEIEQFITEEAEHSEDSKANCEFTQDFHGHYVNYMKSLMHQGCLRGWKIVLDTANGAAFVGSPSVFRHYEADLICLGDKPDGFNINKNCGSEYPEALARAVVSNGARLGIAHDGDADRAVFCDETGSIVSGEEILGIVGLDMLRKGELHHNCVVTTIQSNLGLDKTIVEAGGKVLRTAVGDRHVLHKMLQGEYGLGGENSGHYLVFKHSKSGDGLLMAVMVVELMLRSGKPLSELRKAVTLFPQRRKDLGVETKIPLADCPNLYTAMDQLGHELTGIGRILVRYSGTEQKLRLLAEAEDADIAESSMDRLYNAARKDLKILYAV